MLPPIVVGGWPKVSYATVVGAAAEVTLSIEDAATWGGEDYSLLSAPRALFARPLQGNSQALHACSAALGN